MITTWYTENNAPQQFNNLDSVFTLTGEQITKDRLSELIKLELNNTTYYVKRYVAAGRNLRRYLGRSRARAEWENLLVFQKLGIPTPELVAYGEQRPLSGTKHAALITRELINTADLLSIAKTRHPLWQNPQWTHEIITQVADFTRKLHTQRFYHGDLKWRNILVCLEQTPQIYFHDCPMGHIRNPFWFRRGRLKDLVNLYKHAKRHLSHSQCLRFYLQYTQHQRLTKADKRLIKQVIDFVPSAKRWRRVHP